MPCNLPRSQQQQQQHSGGGQESSSVPPVSRPSVRTQKRLRRVTNKKLLFPWSMRSSSLLESDTSVSRESAIVSLLEVESVDLDLMPQCQNLLGMPKFHVQPELQKIFATKSAAQTWLDTA
ncbi:unnamed protein product [Polarella glacialis]|uniref:Uncharacterized protein n=1 Tax=Polarella glacialis TaxID=89957 RepID=A0A813HZI1_POLGL|nr:unnamed protein product [Polarella glacialis]